MAVKDRNTSDLARECLVIADWNSGVLPLTSENRLVIKELADRVLLHFEALKAWKAEYRDLTG